MHSLAAYIHDLDPFLIEFPAGFPIDGVRWYGLSYVVGFFIGFLLIKRVTRVGISTLKPVHVADYVVTMAIAIVVGGRLGYVIFYRPELLITFTSELPFWSVLAVNEGGMASHGGMIGTIGGAWFYAWRNGHRLSHLLDLAAFGAPIGLFFGRIANFINAELIGRASPPSFPLAVKFPQDLYGLPPEETWKLLEIAENLPGTVNLQTATQARLVSAVIDQVQKGNPVITRLVDPLLVARHPSQLYAAVTEGLVVFAVLAWWWARPRKPVTLGAWFLIAYGLMRIFNEFFRMPDEHLMDSEFALIGLTRGQLLSSVMVLAGGALLAWSLKRDAPLMGSWRKVSVTNDEG